MTIDTQIKVGMNADGVVIGADKVKKSLASIQGQIQRTTATLEGGEKGSRKFYEALAGQRGVSVNALKPYLDQLDAAKLKAEAAKKATNDMRGAIDTMGPKLAALFSGAAVIGFASKLVSVQREFDVLNSSLITVTGSSANAEREMQWIKDFAKETPFGLAQATQGFVKMKALGLEPTRASLTSFGNTASAMGKDLNQMIEAVADASTGEFERLKEFGIKARKAGNEVSLTFQGVTTTIGNSATEITRYLENIGNVEFAGAMAERAKTLDGAISELSDSWDELFRTVNNNNTGSLIFDSVTLATGAISDAITVLNGMAGAADANSRATGAMAAIQGGIATVFETVAVVGANLKFVLVGIGNEIGGLAAQVGQAAQFNFAGVRAIREQMVSDSQEARKEIDATTARILGARAAAKEFASYSTRNSGASTDPRRTDAPLKPKTGGGGGEKSAKKEIDEAAKGVALYNDLISKGAGFTATYAEQMASLARSASLGGLSVTQVAEASALLNAQQPGMVSLLKAENDAVDATIKNIQANNKLALSYEEARIAAASYLDTINKQAARQVDGAGLGSKFRENQQGVNAIEDKLTSSKETLGSELRTGKIDSSQYEKYLSLANDTYNKEVAIYKNSRNAMSQIQGDWSLGAQDSLNDYLGDTKNVFSKVGDLVGGAFKGMEDALVEFATTGKLSFSSLASSIVADMMRIAIQQSITGPLAAAASSFFAGTFADGGAFDGGVQAFAKGGTFTNSIVDSPTLFKFAKGTGLMGEAGPEAIMPLSRGADGKLGVVAQGVGGGSSVVVNVIESPGQGGQQSRRSENGVDMIDVFVEKIKSSIAGDISRGSGAVPAALSRNYGLNRVAGAY